MHSPQMELAVIRLVYKSLTDSPEELATSVAVRAWAWLSLLETVHQLVEVRTCLFAVRLPVNVIAPAP